MTIYPLGVAHRPHKDTIMKKLILIFLILIGLVAQSHAAVQTLFVSASGSGSTCSEGSPCTISTALSTVSGGDNDVIIMAPGTYSGSINLNDTTNHDNLTITTTDAVISALGTFARGIPNGIDNRPLIAQTGSTVISIADGVSGVSINYLKIRMANSPFDDSGPSGAVSIAEYVTEINYCEIYNGGQGVYITTSRGVAVNQCHIHDLGASGTSWDTHGVTITNYQGDASASAFADGIRVMNSSIHDLGGDCVQESSQCYAGSSANYVTIDNCELYNAQEQVWDSKGTAYFTFSNNNVHDNSVGSSGYGSIIATDPEDCNPPDMNYWYIYNNIFHDEKGPAIQISNDAGADYWYVYNNIFYKVVTNYEYNYPAIRLPSSTHNYFYSNTVYDVDSGAHNTGGIAACGSGANVKNNLFYMANGAYGAIASSFYECSSSGTPSYNYIYPTGNGQTGTNAITSSDPGMTNPAAYDFTLETDSVCVDAGTTLGSPYDEDILGVSRPQNLVYDVGAYEYDSGGGDETAPTLSNASPSGAQACTSDPRDVVISVDCSDDTACTACKADTADIDIDSMSVSLSNDGGTWSATVSDLDCDDSYTYYAKCEDAADNESDATTISFSIAAAAAESVPVVSGCIISGGIQ